MLADSINTTLNYRRVCNLLNSGQKSGSLSAMLDVEDNGPKRPLHVGDDERYGLGHLVIAWSICVTKNPQRSY
jgi:hypothetical protein